MFYSVITLIMSVLHFLHSYVVITLSLHITLLLHCDYTVVKLWQRLEHTATPVTCSVWMYNTLCALVLQSLGPNCYIDNVNGICMQTEDVSCCFYSLPCCVFTASSKTDKRWKYA